MTESDQQPTDAAPVPKTVEVRWRDGATSIFKGVGQVFLLRDEGPCGLLQAAPGSRIYVNGQEVAGVLVS